MGKKFCRSRFDLFDPGDEIVITLIYRKRDRLLVGTSHKRRTTEQTAMAVVTEIDNICVSELGGVPDDYGIVQVSDSPKPGFEYVIGDGGTVSEKRSNLTAADRAYQSKSNKLLALGLTQEEIDA